MKLDKTMIGRIILVALGLTGLVQVSQAQVFTYRTADLCLGFRKTGSYQEANEVVVDIGQASNYVDIAIGTTIPVPNFTASQLSPGSFTSFDNLQWSVTGGYIGTTYSGYPKDTVWVTAPRSSMSIQTTAPTRLTSSLQASIYVKIQSIFGGAKDISTAVGVSNQFNTAYFEQESLANYPNYTLSVWMA